MKKKLLFSLIGVMCVSTIAFNKQKVDKQVVAEQKAIVSVIRKDPGIPDPLTLKSRVKRSVDPGIPDPLT